MVRLRLFGLVFCAAALPAMASAESTPQPKYPPGFECSAVAAGSRRQACNRAHLDPPMGAIPQTRRGTPEIVVQHPGPPRLPTGKPPTIPRLPGTIDPGG